MYEAIKIIILLVVVCGKCEIFFILFNEKAIALAILSREFNAIHTIPAIYALTIGPDDFIKREYML